MQLLSLFENAEDQRRFSAGEQIFVEGQPGRSMFVVIDGTVSLQRGSEVYQSLAAGDLFGEMSLVDDQPRSLDAVAKTDCALAEIDERRFLFLVNETPSFALHVMAVMADRLRSR